MGEAGGRAEGDVHVTMKDLHYIGTRNLHALRQRAVIQAELLHPLHNGTKENRPGSVYALHHEDECIKIYTPAQEGNGGIRIRIGSRGEEVEVIGRGRGGREGSKVQGFKSSRER